MSAVSSSRVRSKTTDLAQFFLGHRQSEPVENSYLTVPDDSEPTTPKKSKIPFLGRTRKKSTHSVKSANLPSTSGRGYASEAPELPTAMTTKKDRRVSHPIPSPEPAIKKGSIIKSSLPATKAIPQISVSSPSLSSKFVAHFSNSKLRKAPSLQTTSGAPSDGSTTDTLSPRTDDRTASLDSTTTTTGTSTIPPSTPRDTLITITSAPDNLEAYSNIFTLSKAKKTLLPRHQSSTPASEYRDYYTKTQPSISTSPSRPRFDPSAPSSPGSRLSSSSRNETRERDSRRLNESSNPSKLSKKHPSGPKLGVDSTPENSANEYGLHLHSGNSTPTIDVVPAPPRLKAASPTPRPRLRSSSSIKETPASDPPSIPLPDPPVMNNSPPASPTSLCSPRSITLPSSASILRRPRANTTGSVPLTPVSPVTITSRPSLQRRGPIFSGENSCPVKKSLNKEISDLDGMTVEQLKEALAQRNHQYAELTTHLLEVTKGHAVEKAALEKKITALVAEVARKDKEIQGFTWMLNNRGTLPLSDDDVDYTKIPGPRIQRSPSTASSKISSRRIQQGDDSGAESPSGNESVPGSAGSIRLRKGLRPLTLGESSYSMYRSNKSASARGPSVDNGLSDQGTSVYSLSSCPSATSSNSSLLPPSPSSINVSSLSAIPEVSTVSSSRMISPSRISLSTRESLERERDYEKKSRDVPRSSKHVSASSFSSSSSSSSGSAATSTYAANLKRGRPPSIAQVLHKSNTIDDVLEKRRPFAVAAPTA